MESIFLNLREVRALTGLSTSTIYRMMDAGKFPRAKRLAESKVGWLRSDVEAWAAGLPDADPSTQFAPKRRSTT